MNRHQSIPPLHPGEILREDLLPALPISKTQLAKSLQISRQTLYAILNERQPVTAKMALRLGKLFGNGAPLWLNLQRNYDLATAEKTTNLSTIPTLHPATNQ
ncbi:MAG: HigA family addiction module antidote protein [Cellvibrionales bacterium]|nr:HigA family addiction module antidote protein [Cellvibrionales bacterium]